MIGDKDLFDVWDDADPAEARVVLLGRIVTELRHRHDDTRRLEALRLALKLFAAVDDLRARVADLRAELES